MKRVLSVFIVIAMLFVLSTNIIAIDENKMTIEVESVNGSPGSQVTMKINIKDNPGIVSTKITLSFGSQLTLQSVEYNAVSYAQEQEVSSMAVDYGTGYFPKSDSVVINWVALQKDVTGDFTLATLTFSIAEGADEGTYPITATFDEDDVYNFNETNIPTIIQNGGVVVKNYIIGDVNNDGKVNSKDRMTLARHLADWTGYEADKINMAAADVNLDGVVNTKDRMILARHLADWTGYEQLPYIK